MGMGFKGEWMFDNIKKRDGRIVEFDSSKITSAKAYAPGFNPGS
jgi:hypothetical protein